MILGWNNKVKVHARRVARRYNQLLERAGKPGRVTVHGSRILFGLVSYSAADVEKMANELEARL